MDIPSWPDFYAWTTKLTPEEVAIFIEDIAEIVVVADLAGLLTIGRVPGRYWNDLDLIVSITTDRRPLDQIEGVFRFQMNHALMRPHFSTSDHAAMPHDPFFSQADIFWGAVKRKAQESGCYDNPTKSRDAPRGDDFDVAARLVADRFEAVMAPLRKKLEADRARRDEEEQRAIDEARHAREKMIRDRPNPPPRPQPYGISPRGAEMIVAEWMRHMGILDAEVTRSSGDGGVDVTSSSHVAQVKHYKGKVGVVEVRQLFGVAAAQAKIGLFFTSTGYTVEAISFASAVELPLFTYDAEVGALKGMNLQATRML